MIADDLGPAFTSSFANHRFSEYGKRLTATTIKKMCYEDARLVRYFVNREAYRQWFREVRRFCEGNMDLCEILLGITGCYMDYISGKTGKTYASELMKEQTEQLQNAMAAPQSMQSVYIPFKADSSKKSAFDISSLIFDVDEVKKLEAKAATPRPAA